ncbi:hypothetical protein BD413DRAFT_32072 [Trametes elegans]|nr:hypothetical protein BD413DRAFT_32072 [Trametes elegans]
MARGTRRSMGVHVRASAPSHQHPLPVDTPRVDLTYMWVPGDRPQLVRVPGHRSAMCKVWRLRRRRCSLPTQHLVPRSVRPVPDAGPGIRGGLHSVCRFAATAAGDSSGLARRIASLLGVQDVGRSGINMEDHLAIDIRGQDLWSECISPQLTVVGALQYSYDPAALHEETNH